MPNISKDEVRRQRDAANQLLAMWLPQSAKKIICTQIESLLMATNSYVGFNHNYWRISGCEKWEADGKPDFDAKKLEYIIGKTGAAHRADDDWSGSIEGEYSRTYFFKP